MPAIEGVTACQAASAASVSRRARGSACAVRPPDNANPAESKLSNESPVGRALMGRKRNEEVSVPVPKGAARKLKITKIDAA